MRRRVALAVLALALGGFLAAPAAAQTAQLRIREATLDPNGLVRLVVSVAGEAAEQVFVRDNFHLTEAGVTIEELAVTPLFESRIQPVAVALVIDTSGSTRGRPLEDAKAAARSLVQELPDGVRIALVSFSNTPELKVDFTTDRTHVIAALTGLEARGETALNDAIATAAGALGRIDGQRNMVVFSDGGDTVSHTSIDESIRLARDARAATTTVGLVTPDYDQAPLDRIAAETDGRALAVTESAALGEAFTQVARDIASQYVLEYTSTRYEPKELTLEVAVSSNDFSASDSIVVLNPRIAPAAGVAEEPVAVPGAFASPVVLAAGVAAAFLAMVLVFSTALRGAEATTGRRALRRGLGAYGTERAPHHESRAGAIARHFVDIVDQVPKPKGFEERLQLKLERAGWPLRAGEFMALMAAAPVGGIALGWGVLANFWLGVLLAIGSVLGTLLVLHKRVSHRASAFLAQLPETLQLLAGSLHAGYGLQQAIDTVAQESEPPTSSEFARVLSAVRLGVPLDEALDDMVARMGSEDFRWVVMAIAIQRQVGGNLAELLETVADTLREREQLRRQVKVLSAEGRLSAIILTALPFLLAGYMAVVNPRYLGALVGTWIGRALIIGALTLMVFGVGWMRKIIRIEI